MQLNLETSFCGLDAQSQARLEYYDHSSSRINIHYIIFLEKVISLQHDIKKKKKKQERFRDIKMSKNSKKPSVPSKCNILFFNCFYDWFFFPSTDILWVSLPNSTS